MLLIDIRSRSTNASAAEFILHRLKLNLAGRYHHQVDLVGLHVHVPGRPTCRSRATGTTAVVDLVYVQCLTVAYR